ncbi:hypothetical protein HanRHA438_Chr10g0440921 [Helianthus annuus]|nr:hypothetical protein HanRHA438_Chr10g0440921 [Helianthus annuus]
MHTYSFHLLFPPNHLFIPSISPSSFQPSLSLSLSLSSLYVQLFIQIMGNLMLLSIIILSFRTSHGLKGGWQKAHATFYGGEDASGTMGMCLCHFVLV